MRGGFTPALGLFVRHGETEKESKTRAQNKGSDKGGVEERRKLLCSSANWTNLIAQIGHYVQKASVYLKRFCLYIETYRLLCVPILVQLQFTMHMEGKLKKLTCTCDKTASIRNK